MYTQIILLDNHTTVVHDKTKSGIIYEVRNQLISTLILPVSYKWGRKTNPSQTIDKTMVKQGGVVRNYEVEQGV